MASTKGFYRDQSITALTGSFVNFSWQFAAKMVVVVNDETSGSNGVAISFDGTNQHMVLMPGDSITIDHNDNVAIGLSYVGAAPAYRLMVEA